MTEMPNPEAIIAEDGRKVIATPSAPTEKFPHVKIVHASPTPKAPPQKHNKVLSAKIKRITRPCRTPIFCNTAFSCTRSWTDITVVVATNDKTKTTQAKPNQYA